MDQSIMHFSLCTMRYYFVFVMKNREPKKVKLADKNSIPIW